MSKEGVQVSLNLGRLMNDAAQRAIQAVYKLLLGRVIAVVRRLHPHKVPEGFDGVELGAVAGQGAEVKAVTVAAQPLPHLGGPMVSGIVVNQEDLLPPVPLRQAVEKGGVASTFKNVAMPVVEFGPIQVDRAKDFLSVPLTGRRNQRLLSAARPRLIQTGILPKTGFVAIEQRRPAISGFFLVGDRCSAASDRARLGRLWPTGGVDAAPRTPSL